MDIGMAIATFGTIVFVLALGTLLSRQVFRIDDIIAQLKSINDKLDRLNQQPINKQES
ncbi:hypothetical protein [Chitinophaga pinensis]|uniref:Uncharacterized protein n=1 Tax=Chitinophaga pinensis (strain ATCC 43595 / DSM 2588 / LMG 13176 / NBRC 15968 / NCIMB 11800 / UQM 2034) TaxID=485918 RepID=A0A979GM67_CHIPD|nr:hypothetical protein [Chitinophaga pinensis]ACU57922.1 hypothetical protein Cpin_0424 [Chitinophaga pinensis DSM 2588]